MSASYPSAIKTFTDPSASSNLNFPSHSQQHIDENAEITAIETELGLSPKGTYTTVKDRLDGILATVYPIGSIYISALSTRRDVLFGFGTWAAFGSGRTLVGIDTAQTEFNIVEKTGGAKTHTLTVSEMPAHTHSITARNSNGYGTTIQSSDAQNQTTTDSTGSAGGGAAHNNLQPYIVVYMWKRTA